MQDYIKKYFWVLGPVTLIICAVLLARSVNNIVEGAFLSDSRTPVIAPQAQTSRRPAVAPVRSKTGEELVSRNMFCSDCQPAEAPPAEAVAQDTPGSVPYTALPLQLVATSVSSAPEFSFATIRNITSAAEGAYWVGQMIPGAGKVEVVAGKYIDFRNDSSKRLERLALLGQERRPAPPAPTTEEPPPVAATGTGTPDELGLDEGIKQIDESNYEIARNLVDKVLANPMSVARGARVVPSVKDGKPNGFKLYAIRPSSVFAKIGLRNGDTIHTVNGFDLTTPDKALEVYTKVREASNLTVTVTRRGQPVTLNYSIR